VTAVDIAEYCRAVESYLCQKNDGHLIRVVGPSFEVVARWATDGVPVKIAFGGIDQYFERYYRQGARRRPVRIDFCDGDVRDVFDRWRRATGLMASASNGDGEERREHKGPSLREHLERGLMRLTDARVGGRLGAEADRLIDEVSRELELVRQTPRGPRGEVRQEILARLSVADNELLTLARQSLDASALSDAERAADEELEGFRTRMPSDRFANVRARAVDRVIRERLALPTLALL
jgi:hypothetical protein